MKYDLIRGDFAVVDWIDACSDDEWEEADKSPINPEHITTCGIVYEVTEDKIVLALNHDPANNSFSCRMCIPIGMVKDAQKLKR